MLWLVLGVACLVVVGVFATLVTLALENVHLRDALKPRFRRSTLMTASAFIGVGLVGFLIGALALTGALHGAEALGAGDATRYWPTGGPLGGVLVQLTTLRNSLRSPSSPSGDQ